MEHKLTNREIRKKYGINKYTNHTKAVIAALNDVGIVYRVVKGTQKHPDKIRTEYFDVNPYTAEYSSGKRLIKGGIKGFTSFIEKYRHKCPIRLKRLAHLNKLRGELNIV